ncbi:hypothetical protein AB0C38_23005 [Amycolatopsis sp. NPDC048633]|uniref:hypothetical protein n=1 Tax=Amycolatopsis sp. NPDC048633 TaxID=3157095 RepID=UPI0033D2CE65
MAGLVRGLIGFRTAGTTLLGTFNGLVPHFTGRTGSLTGFVTDVVEDKLVYGMEQLGLAPQVMRRRVEETLDLLGIAELRRRPLRTLSGGQQHVADLGARPDRGGRGPRHPRAEPRRRSCTAHDRAADRPARAAGRVGAAADVRCPCASPGRCGKVSAPRCPRRPLRPVSRC